MLMLTLDTLCNYVKGTPSSRNMIEGQSVINSGMIILCGATIKSQEKIDLYSLCLQTSGLTSDPHVITGTLMINCANNNNISEMEILVGIKNMNCSCKAGTGHSCKHIVAVLLYCNRNDLAALELLSSTDTKCLWKHHKGPVLEQFQALPTETFCCIKPNRLPALSPLVQSHIRNRLINSDGKSAVAKHRNRNPLGEIQNIPDSNVRELKQLVHSTACRERPEDFLGLILNNATHSEAIVLLRNTKFSAKNCCQKTYNSTVICHDVMETALRTKRSQLEWKNERKYRITGSRCYSVYTYAQDNWAEKARKYFWPTEFKNKYVIHGLKYESEARDKYIQEQAVHVEECGLIVVQAEPWMAYSPDGIIMENSRPTKLLEIKCPFEMEDTRTETLIRKCKRFLCLEDNNLQVRKKHQYYGQIQFGMAVLNLKICDFVIYSSCSTTIKIINVPFDNHFVTDLLVTLKKNYFEKMIHAICTNSRL